MAMLYQSYRNNDTSSFLFSAGEGRSLHDKLTVKGSSAMWHPGQKRQLDWDFILSIEKGSRPITRGPLKSPALGPSSRVQRKVIVNPRVLTEATGKMTSNKNRFPLKLHLCRAFSPLRTWAEVDRPLIWHQDGQSLQSFVRNILYRFFRRQCNKGNCFVEVWPLPVHVWGVGSICLILLVSRRVGSTYSSQIGLSEFWWVMCV